MNPDLLTLWEPHGRKEVGSTAEFIAAVHDFLNPRVDTSSASGDHEKNRGLFRGVPNADWDLMPSLPRSRTSRNKDWMTSEMLCDIEMQSLQQFMQKAPLYLDQRFLPHEPEPNRVKIKWLQLMQHYNARTRLLDWTASAFAACYFAAVDNPDDDGAVWMVECGAHADRMAELFPEQFKTGSRILPIYGYQKVTIKEADLVKRAELRAQLKLKSDALEKETVNKNAVSLEFTPCFMPTNRMSAQRGWFSCASIIDVDHGEAVARAFDSSKFRNRGWCRRIIIKRSAKSQILRDLWHMNITAESIYGGLDGLGRSMRELTDLLKPDHRRFTMEDGLLTQELK
ncbi:MAG TPA: FRG domain-containing protein [Phycisphaerae bacterium]|jgi:hypothetical protein